MSVYRPAGERLYRYDFQLRSRRFYGPTGCATKKAAEAVERRIKTEARTSLSQPSDTLDAIAGRWWQEKGRHRKDHKDVEYRLERILLALGPNKSATELRQGDVSGYVAMRRVQPIRGAVRSDRITAPATINRELDVMRAAWFYAIKCEMALPRIDWSDERLDEPETRERVATEDEEDAIFRRLRPDYAPFFAAILETGWRWGMASSLRWGDDRGDVIQREGKGGRMIRTPVTRFLRALIEAQRGKHPEFIWTFEAHLTRWGRIRGEYHPLKYSAARAEWDRACDAAGVEGLTIHQLRHTAATRLLRATGNLGLVQKALAHTRITTTMRYAHVIDDDLRAAMEQVRESREKSREGSLHTPQVLGRKG